MAPAKAPWNIDIVYFDAASGHRSAARALQAGLRAVSPHSRVRSLDLLEIIEGCSWWHEIVRTGNDLFNEAMREDRVWDLRGKVQLGLLFHDALRPIDDERISRFWSAEPPDAVVSVTPMYNPALYRSARLINPRALCVTIPVDCEQFKPRYWFTREVEQYYFCATDRLLRQARAARIPPQFRQRIEGMLIDPAFYAAPPRDIAGERARLGLDPVLPTGMVCVGGQGSACQLQIAEQLARAGLKLNLIFLCGRNAAVHAALQQMATPYRKVVLGYLEPPGPVGYYQISDFVIGRPGTMTIHESLMTGNPLVLLKSRGMRPVQKGNEVWVAERGIAVMVDRPEEIGEAVKQVLATPLYSSRVGLHRHRGVFDASQRICSLLQQPGAHE